MSPLTNILINNKKIALIINFIKIKLLIKSTQKNFFFFIRNSPNLCDK